MYPIYCCIQGRIINVSSVAGLHGYPGLSVYCATKHALEGLSQVIYIFRVSLHGVEYHPIWLLYRNFPRSKSTFQKLNLLNVDYFITVNTAGSSDGA